LGKAVLFAVESIGGWPRENDEKMTKTHTDTYTHIYTQHTHTHTHTHTYIHTYIHTYTYTRIRAHKQKVRPARLQVTRL